MAAWRARFLDLETQECVKKTQYLLPGNHMINDFSLTNRKGQFTEDMPHFIEVKKSHKDIWYLKVVTTVEISLWGK